MDKKSKELVPPGLVYLADNLTARHNLLGDSKGSGAKWAKGLGLPGSSETIFFAGCGYQYSSELESLSSLVRRMDKSIVGAELPMRVASFQRFNILEATNGQLLTYIEELCRDAGAWWYLISVN